MKRIQNIKDRRKLFADSSIVTTTFLKKCVAVPKYDPDDLEEERQPLVIDKRTIMSMSKTGVQQPPTLDEYEDMQLEYRRNKFKRGGMTFEDYNYQALNKYILIDPGNPGAGDVTPEPSETASHVMSHKSKVQQMAAAVAGGEPAMLNDVVLD